MSTNYYLKLHIGKTYASPNNTTSWITDESSLPLRDILYLLETGECEVEDEYGRTIEPYDLLQDIMACHHHEASNTPFS